MVDLRKVKFCFSEDDNGNGMVWTHGVPIDEARELVKHFKTGDYRLQHATRTEKGGGMSYYVRTQEHGTSNVVRVTDELIEFFEGIGRYGVFVKLDAGRKWWRGFRDRQWRIQNAEDRARTGHEEITTGAQGVA